MDISVRTRSIIFPGIRVHVQVLITLAYWVQDSMPHSGAARIRPRPTVNLPWLCRAVPPPEQSSALLKYNYTYWLWVCTPPKREERGVPLQNFWHSSRICFKGPTTFTSLEEHLLRQPKVTWSFTVILRQVDRQGMVGFFFLHKPKPEIY